VLVEATLYAAPHGPAATKPVGAAPRRVMVEFGWIISGHLLVRRWAVDVVRAIVAYRTPADQRSFRTAP
jgi:hypothetical protein